MRLFPILFFLVGCVSMNKNAHQGVFSASYEVVWQAVLLTMKDYPLIVEDIESGEIETGMIQGYTIWQPPTGMTSNQNKRKYKIKIFLEKDSTNPEPVIKVHVIKDERVDKDFIEHSTPVISSGLEEKIILYRIKREILLEQKKSEMRARKNSQSAS